MSDSTSPGADIVTGARIVYDGGRNAQYDLTANDSRFYRDDEFLVLFETDQVHTFKIPVYLTDENGAELITIEEVVQQVDGDSSTYNTVKTLVRGVDWEAVGQDSEAMAHAYLIDNDAEHPFQKVLVKQIRFLQTIDERKTLRIKSHRFYLDLYDLNGFDGVGPSYTPSLGKYLLDKVQDLEATVVANLANTFAVTDTATDMLEEDLTGIDPRNYVQDEPHLVATASGIDTLMPARGSFYSHDFRMWKYSVRTGTVQMANKRYNLENQAIFIYQETSNVGFTTSKVTTSKRVYLTNENYDDYLGMAGSFIDRAKMTLLRPDVDYVLENLNAAKTEKSESEYGVYDTVRFIGSMNGTVLITYHAFGGAVVFEDVQDMRQDITNLMRILTSKNLVTSDILDKQPIIREMLSRLQVIEQYHRHFDQVEHAVYMGTKGFHWINIAELYDVAWDEVNNVTDEIGTFRVESLVRGWCYEFILSIDLKKKIYNMLRCKTLATNDVNVHDLKDYVTYIKSRDDVAIRCCWTGDGTTSGIMLQLGWNFDNYPAPKNGVDNDTIIVTDKSGMTSKWRLVYNPLDNVFEGSKSNKVCNHTRYTGVTDTNWQSGKNYYSFEDVYTYYRTASLKVKEGVEYYTLVRNALYETSGYVHVNLIQNEDVSKYTSGTQRASDDDGNSISCTNGVFERLLYKKIPKLIDPNGYTVGTLIDDPGNVFEVANGTYTEDDQLEMPKADVMWYASVPNCHQLRRVLEPSDGLLSWFGNVHLDFYNAKSFELTSSLNAYTQPILDINTIKGLSVKLYDRKYNKILSRSADLGYSEATYEKATGRALASKKYYERSGSGTVNDPYRYYRSSISTGGDLENYYLATSDQQRDTSKTYFIKTSSVDYREAVAADFSNGAFVAGTTYYERFSIDRFTMTTKETIVGQIIFDLLDLCGASFHVYKDESSDLIKFKFDTYLGTDSAINRRFDLRQIDIHF